MTENEFSVEYILLNNLNAYGFIYITTNIINGNKYIGQKIFNRNWKSYLGSGKYLKNAIRKYGKENFTRKILEIAYSKEELNILEIKYIKNYRAVENEDYYNISVGGDDTFLFKGHFHSKESKLKISESLRGHYVSEGTRYKLQTALKGKNNPMYGKNFSEKTRLKMSKTRKKLNSTQTKEIRNKYATGSYYQKDLAEEYLVCLRTISDIINFKGVYDEQIILKQNRPHGNITGRPPISIIQLSQNETIIKIWNSMTEIMKSLNIHKSRISECCNHKRETTGGFKWQYYSEYINNYYSLK